MILSDQARFETHLPEGWTVMSWGGEPESFRLDVVLRHQQTGAIVQLWLRKRVDPAWLLAFLELAASANVRSYVEPKGSSWT